jgi:hypothetical protein
MGLVKVIEVLAQSEKSWEDAARKGVEEAVKSVKNVKSVYIKDFQAKVEEGRITEYRVNAKISFLVEK